MLRVLLLCKVQTVGSTQLSELLQSQQPTVPVLLHQLGVDLVSMARRTILISNYDESIFNLEGEQSIMMLILVYFNCATRLSWYTIIIQI